LSANTIEMPPYQCLYRKLKQYATVDTETFHALQEILSYKTIEKDDYITPFYEARRHIGFVLDGIIRVYHLNEDGTEYNKNFFVADDLFMTSLDERADSSVFVQSITTSQVLLFDYQDYMTLAEKYEVLESILNKILLEYMTQKQNREIELLALDAKDRYAMFVKTDPILSRVLPQFHIASYLGITPTQLSRVRKAYTPQHM